MGWQDAPVVSSQTAQPAWAAAPVMNAPPPTPPAAVPVQAPSLAMAPVGGAEMLLKLGTGALASIPAGVAYGGAAIGKALGADVNPAAVQRDVQSYLTYQPVSDSAKAGEQAAADLARPVVAPVVRAADRAATAVGKMSPVAETMMREAPAAFQAASSVVPIYQGVQAAGNAARLYDEAAQIAATRNLSPEEAAVAKAQNLGLKLLPSQQGRTPGAIAEGLSGQAKLERTLSKQNAKAVDAAAAEEIGLPAGARVTRESLAIPKAQASSVYKEVAELGPVTTDDSFREAIGGIGDRTGASSFAADTPAGVAKLKDVYGNVASFDAKDAVAKVRQLRADASKNLRAPNAPEQNALGYAQRQIADALDDQLDRAAQARGATDLVSKYRAARVQLAKIHTVEDAIRGQNVSAKALAQQQARGVPLSGKLKDIADSYGSFDRVLQDVSKIRDSGPLGVVDYLVGAGAALHNPLLATAALSRPLVRAGLASDLYQGFGRRYPVGPVSPAPTIPVGTSPPLQQMLEAARRRAAQ